MTGRQIWALHSGRGPAREVCPRVLQTSDTVGTHGDVLSQGGSPGRQRRQKKHDSLEE